MGFFERWTGWIKPAPVTAVDIVPDPTLVTKAQLEAIMPNARGRVGVYLRPLNDAMREFGITSKAALAAFLANIAHESGEFKYVEELASGDLYEGNQKLGNTEPGDGRRFKGRGLIQVTGRYNYAQCGRDLGLDLVNDPELLEQPVNACRSACWFWFKHSLGELAERGQFKTVVRRINGGTNGLQERLMYWERAKAVL